MQTSSLAVWLPPLLATFHLTYASAAGIISANNIVIAIAQPLFGILGDYRRARWLVPMGCALCGLAMASVLVMPSYGWVLFAVILSGLGSAAFHPEALSSTRAISGDKIATGSSLFFFGGNIGFALGPLAAAFLLERAGSWGAVWMLLPIGLGLMALWSQYRLYQTATVAEIVGGTPFADRAAARARRKTLGAVLFLIAFIAIRLAVSGGLTTFIPLYFSEHSSLTQPEIAGLLTVSSIAGTVGTLFSGPMADRVGRRVVIGVSMGLSLVTLYLFLHTTGPLQIVALAVSSAALSIPWTLSVIMMQEALPNNVGLASGLSLGTAYGAMGLAVAGLGAFADRFGLPRAMQLVTWLPVVVLGMGLFVPERKREK
jgi:FSR family fosmidomycin resistance protein-like MFS transporter